MRSTSVPVNTRYNELTTTISGTPLNGAFGSHHSGGAHFSFGDGHVSFLSDTIDFRIYKALSTRAPIHHWPNNSSVGGETISGEY
jgi:prepilin-type processing-associated H-X9-DG protein